MPIALLKSNQLRLIKTKVAGYAVDVFQKPVHCWFMKAHIFIALGLLIAAIFFFHALDVVRNPSFGLWELYILGGFLVAGLMVRTGWLERRAGKLSVPQANANDSSQ